MSCNCSCNSDGPVRPFHELQNALLAGKRIHLVFHEVLSRPEEYWHLDKVTGEYVCTLMGKEYMRCTAGRFMARVQDDMVAAVAAEIID
ncbi:MAG TPA: hypothetical protein VN446_10200 [Candidatus Acidoferrum sp.]|nr:hypothetical protein [Candidatus Acidoferrum sp.]